MKSLLLKLIKLGIKMKTKIICTILISIFVFLIGAFIRNIIGGTEFEDLNLRDQEMLEQINEIYERTSSEDKQKVSLIVSPVNEEVEAPP